MTLDTKTLYIMVVSYMLIESCKNFTINSRRIYESESMSIHLRTLAGALVCMHPRSGGVILGTLLETTFGLHT